MEHPGSPAAAGPQAVIAHLQESVQAWIDSDRVLPADGASLLKMLDQTLAALAAEDAPAARAEITAFTRRMAALNAAGVLSLGDGQPGPDAIAALLAGLASGHGAKQGVPLPFEAIIDAS
jgi:hypothetical protein